MYIYSFSSFSFSTILLFNNNLSNIDFCSTLDGSGKYGYILYIVPVLICDKCLLIKNFSKEG